jgi:hypothetical protein
MYMKHRKVCGARSVDIEIIDPGELGVVEMVIATRSLFFGS